VVCASARLSRTSAHGFVVVVNVRSLGVANGSAVGSLSAIVFSFFSVVAVLVTQEAALLMNRPYQQGFPASTIPNLC
jgi:hypothetical protein